MRRIVGITGGFGVGKSTVCKMLVALGAAWIEADSVTHELYLPGRPGYTKIKGYFGDEFVNEQGVDRDKLRSVVLGNVQKIWILNKLIHPLVTHGVRQLLITKYKTHECLIAIESIYFEKDDLGPLIDKLVIVRREPEEVVRSRTGQWPSSDMEKFIKIQPFYPVPDFQVDNSGTLLDLERAVANMYSNLIG